MLIPTLMFGVERAAKETKTTVKWSSRFHLWIWRLGIRVASMPVFQ
jgi:hypothetical protein